jgi:hypothetical protein
MHREKLYSLAAFVQASDPSAKLGFERLKLALRAHGGKLLIAVGIVVFIAHFIALFRLANAALDSFTSWQFWVWLILCVVANFAVKHAESRPSGGFLIFATMRAFVVTIGASLYVAKSTQPTAAFGTTQYVVLGIGVVVAVISLLVLNQIPGLERIFVSESVQVFWEGAVPLLIVVGSYRLAWGVVVVVGFAIVALIMGSLLVGVPAVYFMLSKQLGTRREKRISAWVCPVLNVVGGLVTLQVYLAFLVASRG